MIGVIGLGFVGLTTALGFAEHNFQVYGYDVDSNKTATIRAGRPPFYEPGIKEAIGRNINKTFHLSENIKSLVSNSEVIFICVGTPQSPDGSADLTQIRRALDEVADNIEKGTSKLILIKSTVPPNTTIALQEHVKNNIENNGKMISIGTNPEFLREGFAWQDFMFPDRIVVGIDENSNGREIVNKIYSGFNAPLLFVNTATAEFIKYLSNSLLSTLISFSNELSIIANSIGNIDIPKAFRILHLDKRFSGNPAPITSYIFPGCGYGGYCLPKDTSALFNVALGLGFSAPVLKSNLQINDSIMHYLLEDFFKRNYEKSIRIGILGLSFKPDTDDVRETPAKKCIMELIKNGYKKITAYDPMALDMFKRSFPDLDIVYAKSGQSLVKSSDIIFIITAWKEFRELNFNNLKVYDFRYLGV